MNTLSLPELRSMLQLATEAAREAANYIQTGFRKNPLAHHKGPIDLVTDYDKEGELLIKAHLQAHSSFPIIGEEHGRFEGTTETGTVWYVDPIDGTSNFVHGHPFYGVSIGLMEGNIPILGVVIAPSLAIEWAGIVGDQATRNGSKAQVSSTQELSQAMLATGFPHERATHPDNSFDAFCEMKNQCQAIRRCGSTAIDLCLVADGTYDGYWERKLKPWDFAAGIAIVIAGGGKVASYTGKEINIQEGHILASNPFLHHVIANTLKPLTLSDSPPVPIRNR
ncbi:hypothetical protein BCY86_07880 [Pajaroellobacter abortibovis]|uniref:Inositol-1-monophosphatase n=2 Tax=Pajaroellobacter abortibovis TaxID=1882918 RepID=A0A1L6MYQ2_9BACT|nr:hypothetical protein BCY86_07880 [Pajaroellobacter abortibovis]